MHYLITYNNITRASNNMTADRFDLPWHATWCCIICLICTELHSKIIRYLSAVVIKPIQNWKLSSSCDSISMYPECLCLQSQTALQSLEITKIHRHFSFLFPLFPMLFLHPKARCHLTRYCFQSNQTPAQVPGRIGIVSGILKAWPALVSTQSLE